MTVSPMASPMITVTIDGTEVSVPEGTLVIRAAEAVGVAVPRFCDHPLLEPVGACRQCLVEVAGQRKPLTACTTEVAPGMVVRTAHTSALAGTAQRGVLELLLINHPLDCAICDKGGECPLQNQAMSGGREESRFTGRKRTFVKPVAISRQVLLDRERCVQCARCTRFADQIAGDNMLELLERGANQQVGTGAGQPFDSYFSGNTVQICPVGALTSTSYRFRSRPFDLESTRTVCEHCASGCATRTDTRRGTVVRRLAADDPDVNEEWNCDRGRWAVRYPTLTDRLTRPRVRDALSGKLIEVSWPTALRVAARGLAAARGHAGVLTGGRLTVEDAYAYAKFARVVLDTNDVDFRARPLSAEETGFLTGYAAGPGGVTYADLERAPVVLLAGFEPEEEAPMVFLRLRKGVRKRGVRVASVAPFATRGLTKLSGTLLTAVPGEEAAILTALASDAADHDVIAESLRRPGAVILVGERLAGAPGALTAAAGLAASTGAALAWIPRRAGDRGALAAGAFPALLPGGRPVTDAAARAEVARLWAVPELPATPGRDTDAILAAAAGGELGALVVGGVDATDLREPDLALRAVERTPFVVSLELRASPLSELANVVFPVAAVPEKPGTFRNWENRSREFPAAMTDRSALSDHRVLDAIADELDVDLGLRDVRLVRAELGQPGAAPGHRAAVAVPAAPRVLPRPRRGTAVLATWRLLLDNARALDGTDLVTRAPEVRLGAATARELGAADGSPVTVSTERGAITLPLTVCAMAEGVVWLPANSPGSVVHRTLGATAGALVRIGLSETDS